MSLTHTIQLIIKAQDEASKQVKKVEDQVKKFSNSSKNSMNQSSQSTKKFNDSLRLTRERINKIKVNLDKVKTGGAGAFNKLTKSEQQALVQMNMLDKSTQRLLRSTSNLNLSPSMTKRVEEAKSEFNALNNVTKTWSGSMDYAKSKLQLLGTNTDSLRGKLKLVGTSIQTYVGTKFDSLAQTIKSKVGGSIDSLKGKLNIFKGASNGVFKQLENGANASNKSIGLLGATLSNFGGMVIYDFFMGIVQAGKAAINAGSQLDYFAKRLSNAKGETHQSAEQFKTFKNDLSGLQKEFRKVDMTAVGASAEELAVKLQLPSEGLKDLSKTIAVTSSAFVKEGRTQEDAILAVSDALDGQFMKLKELGISQEDLKNNGWSGDLNDKKTLLESLNETLDEMGFTETAKDITTVDEAMGALTIAGGQLLQKIFVPLTPMLINIVEAFLSVTDVIGPLIESFVAISSNMPDWAKIALSITGVGLAFSAAALYIQNSLIPSLIETAINMGLVSVEEVVLALETGGLSAVFGLLSSSIWAAVTATLSFLAPILAVTAVLAVVAVAVYEVGKSFGWWSDVGSMIDAIKGGLLRLWDAFINNPDVKDFITAISDAWKGVTSAVGPVISEISKFFSVSNGGEFDIVHTIIIGLGDAFHALTGHIRLVYSILQTLYGIAVPIGQAIYEALKPIVCILLGCSPGIVPALEKVQEVFQTVWSFIAGFIGSYVSTVVSVIGTVVTTVQSIVNVFAQLLTGQISLSEAIPMIWNLISNAFVTIGGTILSFITKWAGQLLTLAIRAATNFMNGIVNRIRNLPGKVYGFITSTASRIASGAVNWANNARNAATNTVNSVVNNIQGLPGKVYTEFFNIGGKIGEAASHVIQKAADFANGVKNKVLDILGIHSPGILQEKIGIEFQDISTRSIGEKAKLAYENAKTFASNIISGFESEDMSSLEVMTPEIASNTPTMPLASTVTPQLEAPDTKAITDTVTTAYDTMNNLVGTDLQDLQYMNTQSFNNISLNEETMMKKIYSHVHSTLSTILKTNKTSLNQNTNTTKTQLSKMRNSTTTVTGQMVKAWNSMRTSIVSAARKIDSDATAHFNTLGKTIGGFYGKLQNPSRWGTGPGPKEERRGTGRGSRLVSNGHSMRVMSSRLANATMRENHMPRTITVRSVQNNPVLKGLTDFISDGSNIDVRTLFETGVLSPFNLGGLSRASFGAWENTAKPNIDKIKKTARNWSMKGPRLANRVSSGLTFHLKDFENGTPRIGMNDFINMAYALVNSTSYGYYANSERYGSWLNALNHGVMNCSDGSDMFIALARTCGLPASKVHCYWGTNSSGIAGVAGKGEGHFVARIGGRIMDSVSMRHGSLTSPKVHGYGTGPSPFKSISETNRNSDNHDYASSEDIKMDIGDFTITHKFEGLPDGVDEATISRMINDAPNNERFVKQLANNVKFQIADHRAKVRFERKGNRSKGLGA